VLYFHPQIINSADVFSTKTHTDTLTWSLVVESITTASGARLGGGRGAWRKLKGKENSEVRGSFYNPVSTKSCGTA